MQNNFTATQIKLGERWTNIAYTLENNKIVLESVKTDFDNILPDLSPEQINTLIKQVEIKRELFLSKPQH